MRIKLLDVDNRLSIKYNKVDGIFNWGADNVYPSLVKSLTNSSVTAKQCVDINSKYIFGKGFEIFKENAPVINKKGLTINQLLRIVSKEFSEQNNIFLHINYNALYEVISVDLITSEDVRLGDKDSTGYNGKFIVYDNWDKTKSKRIEKKDFKVIDKFNPNEKVIEAQVESAGGWSKYKGQILHVNSDFSSTYSLSDIDSVLYDAESQFKASKVKNDNLNNGFFNTKLFITKPFESDYERNDFENTVNGTRGVPNSAIVFETNLESDDLDNHFKVVELNSNIDDKQFEYTDKSSKENIIEAYGVPSILINKNDNSIFGNSGELLKQAKVMHWENKEEERTIIIDAFKAVFRRFHQQINPTNNWNIIPMVVLNNVSDNGNVNE